jgi:hypothetical protein
MYQGSAEGLKQPAPLTAAEEDIELSPKWVQLMNAAVSRALYDMNNMKGLSDANRYRLRGKNYSQAVDIYMKALFDRLCEVDEAFRRKAGTHDKFRLEDHIKGGDEQG